MNFNFDARTVAPAIGLEPVPEGWYKVVARKSNMKPTKAGDGGYLELVLEVIEGAFTGRQLFWNLNLFNQSQQAVEIAYKQLSAVCHVTGVYQVSAQSGQDNVVPMLHNIPFMVHAIIQQTNQGSLNNIRGCKDVYGNDPGKQGQGQPQPQPAPAAIAAALPPGQMAPASWQAPTAPAGAPVAQPGWQAPGAPAAAPAPAPGPAPWQAGSGQAPQSVPGWAPPNTQQVPPSQPNAQQPGQAAPWQPNPQPAPQQQPAAQPFTQGAPQTNPPWQR